MNQRTLHIAGFSDWGKGPDSRSGQRSSPRPLRARHKTRGRPLRRGRRAVAVLGACMGNASQGRLRSTGCRKGYNPAARQQQKIQQVNINTLKEFLTMSQGIEFAMGQWAFGGLTQEPKRKPSS